MPDEARGANSRAIFTRVVICFFLSGATGLVYEVLWIRMLGLVFGHTVFAVTTVLSAFMAGLGLGSYLFGTIADRSGRLLRLYAVLEAGIGVSCLAIPLLIGPVEHLYLALYRALHLSYYAFSLTQFVLVLLLLLVPTTLMGGTLPVLTKVFVTSSAVLNKRMGTLYSVNTFGAVLGVAATGYLLLPAWGVRGTLYLSAAVNIGIALLVAVWSRTLSAPRGAAARPAPDADRRPPPEAVPDDRRARHPLTRLVIVALALSGAASMVYEVAWSRALTLIIGSSTYAFTAMLLAFLVGIALGSAVFSRVAKEGRTAPFVFGALQTAIGVTAVITLPVLGGLPDLFVRVLQVSTAPRFVQASQLALSSAAMLLPTLLIGATFPCAVAIVSRGQTHVGTDVGRVYAVNTLGGVLGSFAAGFLLIPVLGAQWTVKVAVLLNLVVGLAFGLVSWRTSRPARRLPWVAASAAAVGVVVWLPAWDPIAMSSGVAIYGPAYAPLGGKTSLGEALRSTELLSYEDGISATVTVHRSGGTTSLRVNGKADASTSGDMPTQLLSGHLPLLLSEETPRSVLIVGLGSGVTVAAVARHPVERIVIVEIEPAVVRAARFFEAVNRNVLADPRVEVVVADGRNFLLGTPEQFDVIISEPSNPWIGGLAALFSREFFGLAARKLKPGGAMVQWVQGYGLSPDDLKMVVRTFGTAFPATTIWTAARGDYLLVGRRQPLRVDLDALDRRTREVRGLAGDLARAGFDSPAGLLSAFVLDERDSARYASGAGLNTDDSLSLEFTAPLSLHKETTALNARIMRAFRAREFPAIVAKETSALHRARVRLAIGLAYLGRQQLTDAAEQFEKAIADDPENTAAWLELGKVQLQLNRPLQALGSFERVLARDRRQPEALFQIGNVYRVQQVVDRAEEFLVKAVALRPHEARYRRGLADVLVARGRVADGIAEYRAASALAPRDPQILEALAQAYMTHRRADLAIATLKQAAQLDGVVPGAFSHSLGRAYLQANRFREAAEALRVTTRLRPFLVEPFVDLSIACAGAGDFERAAEALMRAEALDPFHPAVQRLSALRTLTPSTAVGEH